VAVSSLPPPPRSLRGTEVDGELELDGAGRFVASRRALQLFDYFLTATGEEDEPVIRARIAAAARARLPVGEAERALALYDRYVEYRSALQSAFERASPADGARGALAISEAAQRSIFGVDDAERLFARDNALAAATLERAGPLVR
jgi:lipase chaperone LimK